jgi:hypothetical protein
VENAISELSQDLKSQLIFDYAEGRSYADTGGPLGISWKAVEIKVYRARKILLEKTGEMAFQIIAVISEGQGALASLKTTMNGQFLKFRKNHILGLITALALGISTAALWAQQEKDPLKAWGTIQQMVKDMETAVQSKNLHGIHEPSMKIRAPIKTLKQQSSKLSGDKGQKIGTALKQLDTSVTDLHSASDEGNQTDAETALKTVESALDQLKAQDPDAAFKSMH